MKGSAPNLPANRLHPRVRTLWHVSDGLVAAGVFGVAVGVMLGNGLPRALIVLAMIVIAPVAVLAPRIRYKRWRYEIRERDVFLSKGVVFHAMAAIPFDRIQYAETSQGPLDRWFSLMQLRIKTAGGNEQIPGLTIAEAERLREELVRIAGSSSV